MQQAATPKLRSGMRKDNTLTKAVTNRLTRVMARSILFGIPRFTKRVLIAVQCLHR